MLTEVLDGVGMIGFALAGLLATRGRRMDPVGVFVATFTTAFGGGIMRDIMLDLRPFYWATHPQWVWFAAFLALFAPSIIRRLRDRWQTALYIVADAIGLAFFSVGSTITALSTGANNTTSIIIGVTVGVFGGLLRDVFLNRVPAVLSDRSPYASAAFVGCLAYTIAIRYYNNPALLSMLCGGLVFVVRLVTYYFDIKPISYHWLHRLQRLLHVPAHLLPPPNSTPDVATPVTLRGTKRILQRARPRSRVLPTRGGLAPNRAFKRRTWR
ncbi:MAG: trimeric intracellular cation channel family protein [Sutterella sp.]|nr:trimeric intracellular cation channel family protein [Sutterella sp.]